MKTRLGVGEGRVWRGLGCYGQWWTGGQFCCQLCCSKCRSEGVRIIKTEGNIAAARCCDAVTVLLAAQGVVVKVKVNFTLEHAFEVRHPRCVEPKLQNGKIQLKHNYIY
jgi:hypothetical protein